MIRLLSTALILLAAVGLRAAEPTSTAEPLTLVVMDPLAAPLSCPCVKGYAQRDYEKLGKYLSAKLNRPVKVVFGESLTNTLAKKSEGKADIVIGKESVVRHEAKDNKLGVTPVASLAGKDGKTTMNGLVVVAAKDPALIASDLTGYRIIFGEDSADEKHAAPMKLFADLGVKLTSKVETCTACSDGATKVIDSHKKGEKVATVISSYAQPLLEGCGTIQKGDLRVVGETEPVPFVVAFVNDKLPEGLRTDITKSLLSVGDDKDLCTALETKGGFLPPTGKKK